MPSTSIRDVAQLAGVSVGTVSNVLNKPDEVSPDSIARVQRAIDELGYSISPIEPAIDEAISWFREHGMLKPL